MPGRPARKERFSPTSFPTCPRNLEEVRERAEFPGQRRLEETRLLDQNDRHGN